MEQNTTMNIALYKALLDAGIKEKHAIAAATEAANNGISVNGSLTKLDSDIKDLRFDMEKSISDVEKSMEKTISDVEKSMEKSMAQLTDRLTWRVVGVIVGAMIGTIGISMTSTYFMMNQMIRLLGS